MNSAPMTKDLPARADRPILIEGYASLFGFADSSGDVVRPGAFARSMRDGAVPMLLQHRSGAIAGRWTRLVEDARGLFVRGLVEAEAPRRLILSSGLDGLSIGFRPRVWRAGSQGGRVLADLDLVEVSLVAEPMLPAARFQVI